MPQFLFFLFPLCRVSHVIRNCHTFERGGRWGGGKAAARGNLKILAQRCVWQKPKMTGPKGHKASQFLFLSCAISGAKWRRAAPPQCPCVTCELTWGGRPPDTYLSNTDTYKEALSPPVRCSRWAHNVCFSFAPGGSHT